MSPWTNPSVHTKVPHTYVILPSFLLSLSSFLFIFCVISRGIKWKFKIYIVNGQWKKKINLTHFFFICRCASWQHWKEAGKIQTPVISESYTHDPRYTVGDDSGGYWQAILDGALRIKKHLRRNTFYFFVKR